jgi:hypothetical protein
LLTNSPDAWELIQGGPMSWSGVIADDGTPPAWWVGQAVEDGRSPIGPHGPWARSSGWALPIITRIVSLLVDPLVSDPFLLQRDKFDPTKNTETLPAPRWVLDPQLARPDARIGESHLPLPRRHVRNVFWRQWITQAVYWGRSFLLFQQDATGQPLAGSLQVISVDQVRTDPDTGRYFIGPSPAEGWLFTGDGIYVSGGRRFQLVRLDNPHHPSGVFAAHPDIFRLGSKLARYTEGTFNSGVPAGYLKVTAPGLTQTQADDLRTAWLKHHGGDTRSIAVLSATTEFHPISLNPVDANLIEVAQTSWAELAYAFGLAPEVLGIVTGTGNTYSNIRDWWRMHRDFSLSPWVDTVGGTLTALTADRLSFSVDLALRILLGLCRAMVSGRSR